MSDAALSVTPIGVGAAYSRTGEVQSCYLVRVGDTALCLDMGAGALNALQAVIAPNDLAAVVVSHRHPDHCVDLLALHVYMRWGPGAGGSIPVISPDGVEQRLLALAGETGWEGSLAFRAVDDGGVVRLGEATLTFAEVPHIPGTLAVRVDVGGRSLVYGADCTRNDALVALAAGADVLIAECGDGPVADPLSPHMSGGEAGETAALAGVGRLLLTHCFPEHDRDATLAAARSAAGAVRVDWAEQGAQYRV